MSAAPDPYHLKPNEVSTGTSIFAVCFEGGVVMGADSRTTTGSYIANRVSNKLTPVHDTIYCCRSGSAADTQAISDAVRLQMEVFGQELGTAPDVKAAATLFHKMVYNNKDKLSAGIICGGFDPHEGGSIYSIPLGGALVRQPWAVGGSGSTFIWGWCDANFRPGMSAAECEQFVRHGLALAMSRDGSSGGVIRTVTITRDGVDRKFVSGDQLPTFFEGGPMAFNTTMV